LKEKKKRKKEKNSILSSNSVTDEWIDNFLSFLKNTSEGSPKSAITSWASIPNFNVFFRDSKYNPDWPF